MEIIIIGSGISGLASAYYLEKHRATFCASSQEPLNIRILEANSRLGGHTDTHTIQHQDPKQGPLTHRVDTGFIVFNPIHYPRFTQILNELKVRYQPSNMSFSVKVPAIDLEYGTENLNALFCQKKRLLDPQFWSMLKGIKTFYAKAEAFLKDSAHGRHQEDLPIGEFLTACGVSDAFKHYHLYPMISALWSCPEQAIDALSSRHILSFFKNHHMLQILNRPMWYTIENGSQTYVDAIRRSIQADIRLDEPAVSIQRSQSGVTVTTKKATYSADYLIIATHTDQALKMLRHPSADERSFLSSIPYENNQVKLHSDTRLMPKSERAWSSWNVSWQDHQAQLPKQTACNVTYYMNKLQNIRSPHPFLVSLNPSPEIKTEHLWVERNYSHPMFGQDPAQKNRGLTAVNGVNRTYYAGAYLGWGFHEDGVASAYQAVNQLIEDVQVCSKTASIPA